MKKFISLVFVLFAIASIVFFGRKSEQKEEVPVPVPVSVPAPDRLSLSSQHHDIPALPDEALPLSMQLDALVQRAEAGDPVSICKLLVSINQCHDQVRRQGFSKLALNALTKNESNIDGLLVASVAADEEHMAQRGELLKLGALRCAGRRGRPDVPGGPRRDAGRVPGTDRTGSGGGLPALGISQSCEGTGSRVSSAA
ncbi:MAG: hypothetical protein WC995_01255 [Lysobacteraceae bacterium]